MNVIAKSTNIAPFTRVTANAVSNGSKCAPSTGKVQKSKITVPPPVQRIVVKPEIFSGSIRVSSGIAGKFSKMHLFIVKRTFFLLWLQNSYLLRNLNLSNKIYYSSLKYRLFSGCYDT